MPALRVLHVLEAAGHGTGRHVVDLVTHAPDVTHEVVLPLRPTPRGEDRTSRTAEDAAGGRGRRARGADASLARPSRPRARRAGGPSPRPGPGRRRPARTRDRGRGGRTAGGAVPRPAGRGHPQRGPSLPMVRRAERALAPLTSAMIAVSASEAAPRAGRSGCARRLASTSSPTASTSPRPRPLDRDLRAELGLARDTPLVGWIGRLAPQKAPEVLVARRRPAAPARPRRARRRRTRRRGRRRHRGRAAAAGGPRSTCSATSPGAAGLLDQFDVLALPSRWEGAPYVPLEAFRAHVPVVATDVVGTRDVVVDGETGWLVPPDDPAALAGGTAARRWPTRRNPRRRASRGHARLVAHHDARSMGRDTTDLYVHLTSTTTRSR